MKYARWGWAPLLLLMAWSIGALLLAGPVVRAASPISHIKQATVHQAAPDSPLATPVATATTIPTATATPSPTPTATPTPSPTPTAPPFQVSPLVTGGGAPPPNNGAMLWIGAAALLVLAGSTVLLFAQRQQRP